MRSPPIRGLALLLFVAASAVATLRAEEVFRFEKLLISDSEAGAAAMDPATAGPGRVVAENVPVLAEPGFEHQIAKYFGRPISKQLLFDLRKEIVDYAKARDRHVTEIQIPNQNIAKGALRLGVIVLRYNQLSFRGNRWFSDKLLQERLGIKPGDEVRLSLLEDAVAWVNTNPFRRVQVLVNNLPAKPGKADLIVGVDEDRPFRIAASYDDTGNAILGRNHYTGSLQFGNLWGLDHLMSYQFTTGDDIKAYQVHSFDYRMPLPWRHFLEFTAAYVEATPHLSEALFHQKGKTYLSNLRYTVPVRRGDNPIDVYAGIDFKETNNNLEFGGTEVLNTSADTIQATVGGSLVHRDNRGGWAVQAAVSASPGGINSRNSNELFRTLRPKGSAQYVYGTIAIQRLLNLDAGWSLYSRFNGQISSTNLLPNEQLSIGGASTVRGYDPNIFNGDNGYVFANDLQTPVGKKQLPFLKKTAQPLETRFVLFYDTAEVFYKFRLPLVNLLGRQVGWDDQYLRPIGSTGVGVRMNVGTNFSLNFDYGWHTTRLPGARENGRGHVKLVISY